MSFVTEKEWTTDAGFRAVCLIVRNSHRCGYVEVPPGHPLHGVDYMQGTNALTEVSEAEPLGKRSPIVALTAESDDGEGLRRSPDVVFDVHGGVTFAGGGDGYPADGDGWWFGFDCAHSGDGCMDGSRVFSDGPIRDLAYVVSECESLAQQIVNKTILEDRHGDRADIA